MRLFAAITVLAGGLTTATSSLASPPGIQTWEAPVYSAVTHVEELANGDTLLIGYMQGAQWLLELGPDGERLREARIVSDLGEVFLYDVAMDESGGFLLGGSIDDSVDRDALLVKLDANWNIEWQQSRGRAASNTFFRSVARRSDGWLAADFGPVLFRFDEAGNEVASVNYYASPGSYSASELTPLGSDRFALAGTRYRSFSTQNEIHFSIVEADLTLTRPSLLGCPRGDFLQRNSVAVGPLGEIWLVGVTDYFLPSGRQCNWILRFSAAGDLELSEAIAGALPRGVIASPTGGIIVAREEFVPRPYSIGVYSLDSSGAFEWQAGVTLGSRNYAQVLAPVSGGFVIGGYSDAFSTDAVDDDAFIIRMTDLGRVASGCQGTSTTLEVLPVPPTVTPIVFGVTVPDWPSSGRLVRVEPFNTLMADHCMPGDRDGDGVEDGADNCPDVSNGSQADGDADGTGDACDSCPADPEDDADADGHCADVDNCPIVGNIDQADTDADGSGDTCDACPLDPDNDVDADGVCGNVDDCPTVADSLQLDGDADGAGDACDTCPVDPDNDADADGHCSEVDNCPDDANPLQEDADADGIGDACDCVVPGSGIGDSLRAVSHDDFVFAAAPGATEYPVQRGTIPRLGGMGARVGNYDHACFVVTQATGFGDAAHPVIGEAFYYLVGASNPCGPSTAGLGMDSRGRARPVPACP